MAISSLLRSAKDWLTTSENTKRPGQKTVQILKLESLEDRTVPTAVTMLDVGFEQVALSSGSFSYNPTGSAWTFDGTAGVTSNASGFTAGNSSAVEGSQAAFLQKTGSVSQLAFMDAGTYTINFSAAQRANLAGTETFQVLVDGTVVGTFNNVTSTTYNSLTTSSFSVTDGEHTISFVGTNLNGGDTTVLIDQISVNPQAGGFNDSGFEQFALSRGAYSYNPTGTPWTFNGTSGISSNSSAFTFGNANSPQGSQVAYIQSTGNISQTINLAAGTYALSFSAAQRANLPSAQSLQVLVDGVVVGTFNNLTSTAYSPLTTSTFTVADGAHTVTFMGTNLNGGDNTIFLDQIGMTQLSGGLIDSGFEQSTVSVGSFSYTPTGSAWTYTGTAGVAANSSVFTAGNANSPQGSQVAFIQNTGSISQTISLAAGTYQLIFSAAQRANLPSSETMQVLVDGAVVGTFNTIAGSAYTDLTTSSFTVAAGTHVLTFLGTNLNGGDNTLFLDDVAITQQAGGLTDSGFEELTESASGFSYTPTGSAWIFDGTAGVANNGSAFTAGNVNAPQGSQVAFLQMSSSISQTVHLSAGTYQVSFTAAQRANLASAQTFEVLVDGYVVGTFNNLPGTAYSQLTTYSFDVGYGYHNITFLGTNLNSGDNTVFIDEVSINQQTSGFSDLGFEQLALNAGTFSYNPTGSSWTFSGTAGISGNSSGFTAGNSSSPQGGQVAFLQKSSSISQTGLMDGGTYQLSFSAAQRANLAASQTFQVLVDGSVVGTFNSLSGTTYSQLTTSTFFVAYGNHTITFLGTNANGRDNTVFLDQLTLTKLS